MRLLDDQLVLSPSDLSKFTRCAHTTTLDLGAIVEASRGFVFFKCTGPSDTIGKAQADFDALVSSITKAPAASV